ncbi:hypothetical protein ACOMHN_025079 [Nucella lapillus]
MNPGQTLDPHHNQYSQEDTISINHNWLNGCNVRQCWAHLKTSLADVEQEISDCRDMEGWDQQCQQRPCSLASITTAAGRSTHCPGTLAFITAAAGWSTQRCPWTLALIIDIAAVS